MWRAKILTGVLAAVLLAGCGCSEELLTVDGANYKTAVVETGDYVNTISANAGLYYPRTDSAVNETADAYFVEYRVKREAEVKKGDVIAEVRVDADESDLAEARLRLAHIQEDYRLGLEQRREDIEDARTAASAAADAFERDIARLELQKRELELEAFTYDMEHSIRLQMRALDEMEQERQNRLICSPIDGIVTKLTHFKEGEYVPEGTVMAVVSDPNRVLLYVEDIWDRLRYNMPVTIEYGNYNSRTQVAGRIAAAGNVVPEKDRKNWVLVEMEQYDPEGTYVNIKLLTENIRVNDVMVIVRDGLSVVNGQTQVTLLEDGITKKRSVNTAAFNAEQAWILQGVDAGDTIIIN